jgi:hypothetical protein
METRLDAREPGLDALILAEARAVSDPIGPNEVEPEVIQAIISV